MDTKELDKALLAIVEKKNLLSTLNYNDENYDLVEEELHELEDDFIDEYGEYLEDALGLVHEEYCIFQSNGFNFKFIGLRDKSR
jgi:hypothetical protein